MAVLRLVLKRSGLTAGQISAKTSIARSSAYNLVAPARTGLPTDPGQVLLFLRGCGLQLDQVNKIMWAWERLGADRRKHRLNTARSESMRSGMATQREVAGVEECIEQVQRARAAGQLTAAVGWARRLTEALSTEHAQLGT
ncbi:hypothetical protein VA596_00450 [Amycolatopsis sp., V23-08]|uniref:Helix-turn-helix transcriptional regulator n=1 Tax=Amycolatopsis heterodermiae TaxID=3110235 RepID=A0ABU5QVN8_9PSEU|nr:hypothetical protein [Amycolatopsis sp., V23-08]MEA5357987.1 hypothetical protein [Amycolatopsis sp., V23-08]